MPRLPEKKFFEEQEMERINSATARRMCVVRHMKCGSDNGAKSRFAVWLGIEVKRWNNFEHGWPVPRLVGHRLCQHVPGLTLDWLFLGREETLNQQLLEELRRAEDEWLKVSQMPRALDSESRQPPSRLSGAKTKPSTRSRA